MKIHGDALFRMLRFLSECYNLNKGVTITQEMIDINDDEWEGEIWPEFKGYKIKVVDTDGDHKNDYQIVDYTIRFTSPAKKKTELIVQRTLVNGWVIDDPFYTIK